MVGGWFHWPGSKDPATGYPGDKTNFGYTMKYNKKGERVRGSLLLIRHVGEDAIYRIKSNALYGLALGESVVNGETIGWASFSGKSTYLEPGWPVPVGNHEFLVYVEDRNEPGTGVDRFWVEMHDKDGLVIPVMSMDREASDNAEDIQGGNIVAPHDGKKKASAPDAWVRPLVGLLALASVPLVIYDRRGRYFLRRQRDNSQRPNVTRGE